MFAFTGNESYICLEGFLPTLLNLCLGMYWWNSRCALDHGSALSHPGPKEENQVQSITLPPPWLTELIHIVQDFSLLSHWFLYFAKSLN